MFDGNTTDGPTFTRPLSVRDGTSGSCSLSGTGVNVNYETHTLATDTDGDYIISITGEFDTYLLLYEGAFDPVDVCVDLIALDDDEGVVSTSTVGAGTYQGRTPLTLDDAESYTIVVTAFAPTEFGAYNGSVFGPEDAEVTIDGGTPPPPGDPNPDFAAISLNGTTVPSSGGQLRFKYQLDNSAGSDGTPAEVDIWATVTSADGTTTVLPGQPRMVTVEDGEVVRNGYNQRVIESIPDGTYTYTLLAGDYETLTAFDMEEFTVTKGTPEFAGSLDAYKRSAEAGGMKMASPFVAPAPIAEQWQDASFDEMAPAVISNPTATSRAAKMTPSGQTNEVISATVAPNPVSGAATFQFALKQSSDVTLSVYDALGRQVAQLVSGNMEAGDHLSPSTPRRSRPASTSSASRWKAQCRRAASPSFASRTSTPDAPAFWRIMPLEPLRLRGRCVSVSPTGVPDAGHDAAEAQRGRQKLCVRVRTPSYARGAEQHPRRRESEHGREASGAKPPDGPSMSLVERQQRSPTCMTRLPSQMDQRAPLSSEQGAGCTGVREAKDDLRPWLP